MASDKSSQPSLTFRQEIAACWHFLRRPTLRRLPGRRTGSSLRGDWLPDLSASRLLAWAGLLWAVNLFVLGPIASFAAKWGGAQSRMDPANLPVLMAVFWAPLAEELLFRYGLRRPAQALWLAPLMVFMMTQGLAGWAIAVAALALVLIAAGWPFSTRQQAGEQPRKRRFRFAWRRVYRYYYGWVFHLATLAFAAAHLHNFTLHGMPLLTLPLLVLPQWVTGLVLGWMRSTRGIGASLALHAIFNAGPVLLIVLVMKFLPGANLN